MTRIQPRILCRFNHRDTRFSNPTHLQRFEKHVENAVWVETKVTNQSAHAIDGSTHRRVGHNLVRAFINKPENKRNINALLSPRQCTKTFSK